MPLPSPTPSADNPRRGFTLTELLVVIAIIAMLVAITSVAVVRGLDTAKQTRMKSEVDQLDAAFKAYKEKYGSYPPWRLGFNDGTLSAADKAELLGRIRQHVATAFPRYNLAELEIDLAKTGLELDQQRPDQALVFWLRGFSSDPLHPFVTVKDEPIRAGAVVAGPPVNRESLFPFDESRLVSVRIAGGNATEETNWKSFLPDGLMPSYFPQGVTAGLSGAPYVYFNSADYGDVSGAAPVPNRFNADPVFFRDAGVAVPYWHDINSDSMIDIPTEGWANPDSIQVVASGGDAAFGDPTVVNPQPCRAFPTGVAYDSSPKLFDDDNVTNFYSRARLGSARP